MNESNNTKDFTKIFVFIFFCILSFYCKKSESPDFEPPNITIISPKNMEIVSEIVPICCNATDASGIDYIELIVDDKPVGNKLTLKPYVFYWSTIDLIDSSEHHIQIIGADKVGNKGESEIINLIVDNTYSTPNAVNIKSIEYNLTEMRITWTASQASDFRQYNLLYSNDIYGGKILIETVYEASDTTIVINEFNPLIDSWYWIEVVDTVGYSSLSNPFYIHDTPPVPCDIQSIEYFNNEFSINWFKSSAEDFEMYKILRSEDPNMSNAELIYSISSITDTTCSIPNIFTEQFWYFQIIVTDIWGQDSKSEIKRGSSFPKIVYVTYNNPQDGNSCEIYSMDIDGQNRINLTNNNYFDGYPQFSFDGRKIVFESNRDGNMDIFIMNIQGKEVQNLTQSSENEWYPKFSPNGTKVLFTTGNFGRDEIGIVDVNSLDRKILTNNPDFDFDPEFSPDGSLICFASARNSNNEIFIMNSNGTNMKQLTFNDNDETPVFSADGSKIIFVRRSDIYIINTNGSEQKLLTHGYSPIRYPDGNKILFVEYIESVNEIFCINLDSTGLTQLTYLNSQILYPDIAGVPGRIVFTALTEGSFKDIFLISAIGGECINLTSDNKMDFLAIVQPH